MFFQLSLYYFTSLSLDFQAENFFLLGYFESLSSDLDTRPIISVLTLQSLSGARLLLYGVLTD